MNRFNFDPRPVLAVNCTRAPFEKVLIKFTYMVLVTLAMLLCFVGLILNALIVKTCVSMTRLTQHYQIFLFVAFGNFAHICSLLLMLWTFAVEIMELPTALGVAKTLSLVAMTTSFVQYWSGNCTTYGALVATVHQVVVVKYPLHHIVKRFLYRIYAALFAFDGMLVLPSVFMFVMERCERRASISLGPRPGGFALTYMAVSDAFLKPVLAWLVILPMMLVLHRLLEEFQGRRKSRVRQNAFNRILLRLNLVYLFVTLHKLLHGLFLLLGLAHLSRAGVVLGLVALHALDAVVSSLYFLIYFLYDKQFMTAFRHTRKIWLLRRSLGEKRRHSISFTQSYYSS